MLVDTKKFPYAVNIPWRNRDEIQRWDKVCIECVINYGLPGDKYITSVCAESMTFFFKDHRDAMWFRLSAE